MHGRRFIGLALYCSVFFAFSDSGNAQSVEDVTAAGFPFPAGRYIGGEDCNTAEPDFPIVDFTAGYSHQYEADGDVSFSSILKLAVGHYRITEEWPDFETDTAYPMDADYIATEDGRFQRIGTEGDEEYIENYKYCGPDTAIGKFGEY